MENYISKQLKEGFIDCDGQPLKCFKCESKDLEDNITDQTEQGIMEYDKVCKKCSQVNGHWAYGY